MGAVTMVPPWLSNLEHLNAMQDDYKIKLQILQDALSHGINESNVEELFDSHTEAQAGEGALQLAKREKQLKWWQTTNSQENCSKARRGLWGN